MSEPVMGIDDLLGLGLSAKSAYLYARLIDRFAGLLEARGVDLVTCGPADVAVCAQTFQSSHSARQQLRSALVAAWTVLDRRDAPVRAVRVPPKPVGKCRALEDEPARRLERAAWNRLDLPGLAVLIGMYAGLRRAEIAGLRWEDVEVDEHGLPMWVTVRGKRDLVADVPVHPLLAIAMRPHRRGKGWMFPGRFGDHVVPATIWDWVGRVSLDAGLRKIPTHVLRHTALADANDRSHDLRAVQELARHSRPETTMLYTRTRRRRLREVVTMIDYGRTISEHVS